jgi:acyl-CoA reductase-like NAD-dependent aldehyde dehydrogenase
MVAKLWKDIVPPGVVNILAGDDAVGQAMVTHPTTRMISFTGSVAAGKKIAPPLHPTSRTCSSSSVGTTPPSCSATST